MNKKLNFSLQSTAPSVGPAPQGEVPKIELIARTRPGGDTPESTARKGQVWRRTQTVAVEAWPETNGQPPADIHPSDRNRVIWDGFDARGWGKPSERHLQRIYGGR